MDRALSFAAPAYGQVSGAVQAVHPLVIDDRELGPQLIVDSSVAKPAPLMREFHDPGAQGLGGCIKGGPMAITVTGQPHKTARTAPQQMMFVSHLPDRLTPDLWG